MLPRRAGPGAAVRPAGKTWARLPAASKPVGQRRLSTGRRCKTQVLPDFACLALAGRRAGAQEPTRGFRARQPACPWRANWCKFSLPVHWLGAQIYWRTKRGQLRNENHFSRSNERADRRAGAWASSALGRRARAAGLGGPD